MIKNNQAAVGCRIMELVWGGLEEGRGQWKVRTVTHFNSKMQRELDKE